MWIAVERSKCRVPSAHGDVAPRQLAQQMTPVHFDAGKRLMILPRLKIVLLAAAISGWTVEALATAVDIRVSLGQRRWANRHDRDSHVDHLRLV